LHQCPSTEHPLSPSRKIKRQSLPETLTEALRERILDGEFKAGDALIQDAIAQEYEVSRDAERATAYLGKHIAGAGHNLLVALRESRAASAA
jgi:DNA-binding GntR family transcriptional regulator